MSTAALTISIVRTTPDEALPAPRFSIEASRPPSSSAVPAVFPSDGLEIRTTVDGNGWVVLPDAFGVWVAGAGTLARIDPRTGTVRVTAHGSWDYDFVRLGEYGEGTIFLASDQRLLEMDAGSGTVIARIDVSSLGYVDAILNARGGVWVTASGGDGSQVLARIDPDTGKVERRLGRIGQGLHVLIRAGGYLFVGSHGYHGPTLFRAEPRTMTVTRVPGAPPGAAVAGVGSHVWLTDGAGIRCLDASTLASCGRVQIPGHIRLASFDRELWVLSTPMSGSEPPGAWRRSKVLVVDGRDGDVLAGPLPISGRPSSIAALGGTAWLGYYRTGSVTQVDRCDPGTCTPP